MKYTDDEEMLFKRAGEQSECMGILHSLSHVKYSRRSVWTNVPVIVISSIVGFLSNLILFPNQETLLGVLMILVSLIKSLDNYFDFTRRCEAHRITGLSYIKIARLIEIQLALERIERMNPEDLLNIILNDISSLRESEPIIDNDIIKKFNVKYNKDLTAKPAICNGLTDIKVYKPVAVETSIQVDTVVQDDNVSISPTITSNRAQKAEWRR